MNNTNCYGLIEWFVRENTGKSYDVTADSAYAAAKQLIQFRLSDDIKNGVQL